MSDKSPLPTNGVSRNDPDWPSLIGQAVDDVSRIFRSEADILQAKVGEAIKAGISTSFSVVSLVGLSIWGVGCILVGVILMLHEWLPLWQTLGIVGLCTLTISAVGRGMIRRRQSMASKD